MSNVDNCILTGVFPKMLVLVNKAIAKVTCGQEFVDVDDDKLPSGWYGGSKMLEVGVAIAAFNYVNISDLVHMIRTVPFGEMKSQVQLILNTQHNARFEIVEIFPEEALEAKKYEGEFILHYFDAEEYE